MLAPLGLSEIRKTPEELPSSAVSCRLHGSVQSTQRQFCKWGYEYRAITRHLLHLGGTITSTPRLITVTLDTPAAPRITRALALLIEKTNIEPPRMPGDTRPITYQLAAHPPGFNNDQGPTPGGLSPALRATAALGEDPDFHIAR